MKDILSFLMILLAVAFLAGIGMLSYQQIKHCGWYGACDPHYFDGGIYHADRRAL